MEDERELTGEEQKAKEFVDFYYFWLFHYCSRNYYLELKKRLPALTLENFSEVNSQRQYIAQKIYWGHPLSSMFPQFLDDDCTDVDDLLDGDLVSLDYPISLLETLCEKKPIYRSVERNTDYGMEIIGTSDAHISTDGRLRGSIIAKIDLSAPNSVILYELSKLRESTFKAFPEYFNAPPLYGLQGDYLLESKIIKQTTNASFAVKDDAARAIGLWFWDTIDAHAVVSTFADAWKIIGGDPVPGIEYSEMENGNPFREVGIEGTDIFYTVPTCEVFSQLGYFSSDPSVFRRLYRNTKRSIDACEVLSLKD